VPSVYDNRTISAHSGLRAEPHYCENRHILPWWTPEHDRTLAERIRRLQWAWAWGVTDEIKVATPEATLETWRRADPLCRQYAWYNVLMYFAISRADKLGLTQSTRKPQWKTCPLCNERFIEDSLPEPLVRRLGIDQIDFCAPCLSRVLFSQGHNSAPKKAVIAYLRDLTGAIQRVPPQGFGSGLDDLRSMSTEERLAVLRILDDKPSTRRVKKLFGTWLGALIAAGVLEGETRRTARGTQCLARDGHVCYSLGEKTIDDLLHVMSIAHEREVPYPEGGYRVDFAVGDVFVEYFGLAGDPEYDERVKLKRHICKRLGIHLVGIYPADLASGRRLEGKLRKALAPTSLTAEGHVKPRGDGQTC